MQINGKHLLVSPKEMQFITFYANDKYPDETLGYHSFRNPQAISEVEAWKKQVQGGRRV